VTVFEGYTTEEQLSVMHFLWAKGLNTKDIHKEKFAVYNEDELEAPSVLTSVMDQNDPNQVSCLQWKVFFFHKMIHNWVEKFSQGHSKVADYAQPSVEVAETTVKILLCCGFQHTGKAMGQVHQCWCKTCREINVFSRFKYHVFFDFIHFWSVTLVNTIKTTSFTPPSVIKLNLLFAHAFTCFGFLVNHLQKAHQLFKGNYHYMIHSVLHFISICDLFTDPPLYLSANAPDSSIIRGWCNKFI
jgi:hypothetical protein